MKTLKGLKLENLSNNVDSTTLLTTLKNMHLIHWVISVISATGLVDVYAYVLLTNYHYVYDGAVSACLDQGQLLALVKTHDDFKKLQTYLSSVGYLGYEMYIGMYWDKSAGHFRWLDNEPITWAIWGNGYPDEPNCMTGHQSESGCYPENQDCVRLSHDNTFTTVHCDSYCLALCYGNITTKQNTTGFTTATTPRITTTADTTNFPRVTTFGVTTTPDTTNLPTSPTSGITTTADTSNIPTGSTSSMATTADTTNSQTATTSGIPQPPGTTTDTTSGIITRLSNTISLFSTTTPGNTISDISSSIYTTTQATDCMTSINNSTTTQCFCVTEYTDSKWVSLLELNLTLSELRIFVNEDFEENIKPYISVQKGLLSKSLRRKISMSDDRTSSASLGWISISLISIPIVFAIAIDCSNLCQRNQR